MGGQSGASRTPYARAQKAADYLIPVSTVGFLKIEYNAERLMFSTEGCEQLDKPRTSHSLIYRDPFIYMVGGIIDNVPTDSCKRYHVKDKVWSDISSIKFYGALTSPAIIALEDYIYVFDCYSETQTVFKYSIEYDTWENIPFKTMDFTIPKSLNSTVFRFDSNQLMLMNGITENKEHSVYFFMYDMEKDMFTQERSDRKLIHPYKDRQGNRDYKSGDKIFCQLTEGKVKVFHKKTYYWDNLSVYLVKVQDKVNGVGGGSKGKSLGAMLGCGGKREEKGPVTATGAGHIDNDPNMPPPLPLVTSTAPGNR